MMMNKTLEVICWGATGSWPAGSSRALNFDSSEFGGANSCYQIANDELLVLDAGSGIRNLAEKLKREEFNPAGKDMHVLFSHYHFDHAGGIGSFLQIFNPEAQLHLYGPRLNDRIKGKTFGVDTAIETLIGGIFFPGVIQLIPENDRTRYRIITIDLQGKEIYGGVVEFHEIMDNEELEIGGIKIKAAYVEHSSSGAANYRITKNGKTAVYATDVEINASPETREKVLGLTHKADLVIIDGQYTSEAQTINGMQTQQYIPGFGHNDMKTAAELGIEAGAKKILITHHDPKHDDIVLNELEKSLGAYTHEMSAGKTELAFARQGSHYSA